MGIEMSKRSRLYSDLEPVIGKESAEVIMNSLNCEGTEALVTKEDLRSELGSLRREIDDKFEMMMAHLDKQLLNMKIWFLVTGPGVAFAVVNLYKK